MYNIEGAGGRRPQEWTENPLENKKWKKGLIFKEKY